MQEDGPRRSLPSVVVPALLVAFLALTAVALAAAPVGGQFGVNQAGTTGDHEDGRVAVRASGEEFAVVFEGGDLSGKGIWARRFSANAAPLTDDIPMNSTTAGSQDDPEIAMAGNGLAIVAWDGPDADEDGVFARLLGSGGPIGGEITVNPGSNHSTGGNQDSPAVAMDADGDSAVVFERDDSDEQGIWLRRLDSNGAGFGPSEVRANNNEDANQNNPSVAMDADGDMAVAWGTEPSTILVRLFARDGTPRTGDIPVAQIPFQDNSPAVAMDCDGDFVVAWQGRTTTQNADLGILFRRFDSAGNPVTPATPITSLGVRAAVAMDASGDFVVTYEGDVASDPSAEIGFAQYAPDGTLLDEGGVVDRVADAETLRSSVANNAVGDFIVVWQSAADDMDAFDVFGRRFDGELGPGGCVPGIDNPGTIPSGGSPPGTLPGDALAPAGFGIASKGLTLIGRKLKVVFQGPSNETGPSEAVADIRTASKVVTTATKRVVRLGRKTFTLAAGARKTVAFKLSRKNAGLVRRLRRVPVRLGLSVTDQAGNSRRITKRLKLRAR